LILDESAVSGAPRSGLDLGSGNVLGLDGGLDRSLGRDLLLDPGDVSALPLFEDGALTSAFSRISHVFGPSSSRAAEPDKPSTSGEDGPTADVSSLSGRRLVTAVVGRVIR
jgi:hypothetical protein